jgi:hypothetical protein
MTIKARTVTITVTLTTGERQLYWFEEPRRGRRKESHVATLSDLGVTLRGPFETQAEVKKDIRLVFLGPECKVIEGGMWDPAWDKPQ